MRKSSGSRPLASIWRPLLAPAVLAVALIATAWVTTSATYESFDFLVIAAAYVALAGVVHELAPIGRRFGLPGEIAHALIPGFLFAWHLREQTRPPGLGATLWTIEGALPFIGSMLLAAGVYLLLSRFGAVQDEGWRPRRTAVAAAAFLLIWGSASFVSQTTRWHLLNHNRLLGTPAYHVFSAPTREIERDLWEGNVGPVPDPSADLAATLTEIPTDDPANVVLVLLDTTRADGLAAWGGDPALMPFLNRHAERSWVLSDLMSNSSWTRPSIASLFTGLLPEEHGAVGWEYVLVPERVTLAELFRERGYETMGWVANRQAITPEVGFGQGFDSYEILSRAPHPYARAEEVNESVAAWLADRRARVADAPPAPAFLYVHYLDPHTPYLVAGDRYLDGAPTSHAAARALYDRELRYLDEHLAVLFEMIESELGDNTAILLTSDHGEEFGEHGQRGHGQSLYREQVDVPALVWLPNSSGGLVDARLETRDLFDLALRLQSPATLDVAAWAGEHARDVRYASVSGSKDPGPSRWLHDLLRPYRNNILMRMSEQGSERLIWSAYGDTYELYDLATDPRETTNLVRGRPSRVARLSTAMLDAPRWWAQPIHRGITDEALEELRTLGYIR